MTTLDRFVPLTHEMLLEGRQPQAAVSLAELEDAADRGGVVAALTVGRGLTRTLPFSRKSFAVALAILDDVDGWEIDHSLDGLAQNTLSVYRGGFLIKRLNLEGVFDPLNEIVVAIRDPG